jgi:hypothetical protein
MADEDDACEQGFHDMQPYEHDGVEGIGCTDCGITPEEL